MTASSKTNLFSVFVAAYALFVISIVCPRSTAQTKPLADDGPSIALQLTPVLDGDKSVMMVSYTLDDPSQGGKPLVLNLDTLEPMLQRNLDQVRNLQATDENGVLLFSPSLRRQTAGGTFEVRETTRPTSGQVHVSYFVPVALSVTPKRGPHIDLQLAGGGLSGAFVSFICLPASDQQMRFNVHWVLPGTLTEVSSYGTGDFQVRETADKLGSTLFLAGPVESYLPSSQAQGFEVYALGLPAAALQVAASWTTKAYEVERNAFRSSSAVHFRFMIRSYDGGPIMSGRAAHHSFLLYLPEGKDPAGDDLHDLVAHEMVHGLIESFDDSGGDEGDWYTEGAADYFRLILPYSASLYTSPQYLAILNAESATYYTNALATDPNDDLATAMWSGRNAWMVPYARGMLYFADLDAKLRSHHSRLHVLDLVNETSERIRSGTPATGQVWVDVIRQRVGAWALADWQDMMSGRILMPRSDAFGNCFQSARRPIGIFNLGFQMPVRIQKGAVVQGVVHDSPAEKAGLLNGDTVDGNVDINPLAASLNEPIAIPILRSGARMVISYDPHIGTREGLVWVPRSGDPKRPCPTGQRDSRARSFSHAE